LLNIIYFYFYFFGDTVKSTVK